jgi:DNA-binding GntR family transcriptional regulator
MIIKEQLVRDIIDGTLPGGARITQAELAQRFGVSLTPIREVLRELNSEGLIEIDPFTGATVHRPTLQSLSEIYEMRQALEPLTVPRASLRLPGDKVARATELLTLMDEELDKASWTEANREFHRLLRSGSPNRRVLELLGWIENLSDMYVSLSIAGRPDANMEHAELLAAYRMGECAKILELTAIHLKKTHDACAAVLQEQGESGRPS